jgi:hypothetical protein
VKFGIKHSGDGQNGCHKENKLQHILARMWGKRTLPALKVGMQISVATMEISMEVPQKLKTELPYDPAIPILGIYLKECKLVHNRDTCTSMFSAALFIIAKLWN